MLLEGVNDSAVQMIEAAGYSSMTRLSKALEGDALKEAIKGVHLLGIRSRTQITTDVLEAADRLIAIGMLQRRHQSGGCRRQCAVVRRTEQRSKSIYPRTETWIASLRSQ